MLYGITSGPKRKRTVAPVSGAISRDKTAPVVRQIIPIKRRAAKTNFVSWGRSPFILRRSSISAVKKLVLNGIMWDKENPLAVINDEVVKIGAEIGKNTVVDIKEDSVILNDGTNNFKLRLGQGK